jgi:hypothetical protein
MDSNKKVFNAMQVKDRHLKTRPEFNINTVEAINYYRSNSRSAIQEKKQKLALKEFALGIEGIRRFVNGESIEKVHERVPGHSGNGTGSRRSQVKEH